MLESLRKNTADPSSRDINMDPENLPTIIASYLGITFNLLTLRSRGGINNPTFLVDSKGKDRVKLIKANIAGLETIINYTQKRITINQTIQSMEKTVINFKKKTELGENSDLFIYEFDVEELSHYLATASGTYMNMRAQEGLSVFDIGKINITMTNFMIQLFLSVGLLWEISELKLRGIEKLSLCHYFDRTSKLNYISRSSVFIFLSITFQSASSTL